MNFKKSCILICAIFASKFTNAQQVPNGESFENLTFLPTGWSAVSGSINRWSRVTTSTFPTVQLGYSGIAFAKFTAYQQPNGTTQTIATPVIDYRTRGGHTPTIHFWMYRDSLNKNADSMNVYINTTASLTGAMHLGSIARYSRMNLPDTHIVNGWYKYQYNIPAAFSGAKNYIMFRAVGRGGYNMGIDSVWWDAWPQLCTGKPSGATITSTPGIICGASGTAALTLNGNVATSTGITITWQWSNLTTGPWTTFGGNSTSATTGNISFSRYYRCILACSVSGESDTTKLYYMKVISTPKPTIAVTPNNPSYCSNNPPVLLVASGAATYIWTPSTGLSADNNDSVYASPTASSAYQVLGTDTAGCSGTANVNVTLRQAPTVNIVSTDSLLCYGDSIKLTAAGTGNTYLWAPGGQTTNSIYAKPLVDSKYIVAVKNNFNCSNTAFKNIHVKQKPHAAFTFQQTGSTFQFADSSKNALSWHWDFGDGNESARENPLYTFSNNNSYLVMLVVSDPPCANDTGYFTINLGSGATHNAANQKFNVFPNPVSDKLYISSNALYPIVSVKIMDALGKDLTTKMNEKPNVLGGNRVYNMGGFSNGIYFVRILQNGAWSTIKIVKQ